MALYVFYCCELVHPFWSHVRDWTACLDPKQLVLLDVGYVVDNVLCPWKDEKRVVFLAILAVARLVIWTRRDCMTVQTFLIVIGFFSLSISLRPRSDAIENDSIA